MENLFSRLAHFIGIQLGKPYTFALACLVVLVWGVTGPLFSYSDTWQLVINTGTTIVTFLMVFLLQHTQNRDTQVIQLKLDELIRANANARNALLGLEDLTDKEMRVMAAKFAALARSGALADAPPDAQADLDHAHVALTKARRRFARWVHPDSPEKPTDPP